MHLDDLDLSTVSEDVVRAARSEWVDGTSAWVVTMGGATGLLLATPGRAVWRFRSTTWTMRWGALTHADAHGDRALTVRDAGGEEYTFEFTSSGHRAEFLAQRGEIGPQPRHAPAGTSWAPKKRADAARETLTSLFFWGLGLSVVAGLLSLAGPGTTVIALLILVPAQVCVGVAIVGWGVMLGVRAARE